MLGGNSISERLDPEVVGSVGASWKASAFFAASSGSAVLPKRSVSPFGSVVPLIPVSGIDCAAGYVPSTCAPQPDCCAKATFAFALPRMSLVEIALAVPGVDVTVGVSVTVGVGVTVGCGVAAWGGVIGRDCV